jgi:protein TonB
MMGRKLTVTNLSLRMLAACFCLLIVKPLPCTAQGTPNTDAAKRAWYEQISTQLRLVQITARLNRKKLFTVVHEGTATVRFTIDRSGNVSSTQLIQGSGYPPQDAEAIAMVRRAAPFPLPPAELSREEMTLRQPFIFGRRK